MSVTREYARLTPAELERAVRDPTRALEYIDELTEAGAAETHAPSPSNNKILLKYPLS